MRQWSKRFAALLVCLVSIVLAISQPARAATELKLGLPLDDAMEVGGRKFAELVSQYTNGAVRITVFSGAQLGGDRELMEAAKLGTIEITCPVGAVIAGFEPKFSVFDLPFLFRDTPQALRVLDGPIGQKIAASLEPQGVKGLSWMWNGFRNIITTKKKIMSPSDMRGLKFRSMENPVFVSMFRNLGAAAVPIPTAEVYLALQNGIVDGYDHPVRPYVTIKAYEVAKFVTLTGHAFTTNLLLMNLKVFNSLPKEQQDALLKAAQDAAVFEREFSLKSLEKDVAELRARGVEFYQVDKRPFQEKMAPVYKEFEAKIGKDLIDAILRSE